MKRCILPPPSSFPPSVFPLPNHARDGIHQEIVAGAENVEALQKSQQREEERGRSAGEADALVDRLVEKKAVRFDLPPESAAKQTPAEQPRTAQLPPSVLAKRAREKRERARRMGLSGPEEDGFIPLDDEKEDREGSRLVQEDEHDEDEGTCSHPSPSHGEALHRSIDEFEEQYRGKSIAFGDPGRTTAQSRRPTPSDDAVGLVNALSLRISII